MDVWGGWNGISLCFYWLVGCLFFLFVFLGFGCGLGFGGGNGISG